MKRMKREDERKKQMGILSASPISFKMSRKSEMALKLKSSISKHLLLFLSNYTDDVLSEYITVLVCNGKHQYQAREALKEFLGERSGEFVSWLWDTLLKYADQSKKDICMTDREDATVAGPCGSNGDEGSMTGRLKDLQKCGNGYVDSLLGKNEKIYHPSNAASIPASNSEKEYAGVTGALTEMNSKNVLLQSCKVELDRSSAASENVIVDSWTNESFGKGSSSMIPSGVNQRIQFVDKCMQTVQSSGNLLPNLPKYLPKIKSAHQNAQSSTSGRIFLPRPIDATSHQNEKSRRSVWDRLGKPCDDMALRGIDIGVHGVGNVNPNEEVPDQHKPMLSALNSELSGTMNREFPRLGNNLSESRKLESGAWTMREPHIVNDIRRKRHFSEIGTDALLDEKKRELQCKDFSQNFKKSNLSTQDSKTTPDLISEVLDVKQKLLKIEMEMSKLRSKQVEMVKDGKFKSLSHSVAGGTILAEEDTKSKTVFVTNVHFAATKEALSLYFAKCGVVDYVVILTDKATAQPKGSAYITFASKDSVDKAVALSGTTFFSRPLKVSKKAEPATAKLASEQHAVKLSGALLSHPNRKANPSQPFYSSSHQQWRRELPH